MAGDDQPVAVEPTVALMRCEALATAEARLERSISRLQRDLAFLARYRRPAADTTPHRVGPSCLDNRGLAGLSEGEASEPEAATHGVGSALALSKGRGLREAVGEVQFLLSNAESPTRGISNSGRGLREAVGEVQCGAASEESPSEETPVLATEAAALAEETNVVPVYGEDVRRTEGVGEDAPRADRGPGLSPYELGLRRRLLWKPALDPQTKTEAHPAA